MGISVKTQTVETAPSSSSFGVETADHQSYKLNLIKLNVRYIRTCLEKVFAPPISTLTLFWKRQKPPNDGVKTVFMKLRKFF